MSEKRILFTGGGTAGHVIVNIALIPTFQAEGWEIDYIGSQAGIEKRLIGEGTDVPYYPIATGKLRRYLSIENIKDPFKVLKGMMQAWRIIGKRKPAVIFSKGGFVSVPVVLAAKLRRVPTIIHESDYTPGLANKLAIPFVKKVLTTFPETVEFLPAKKVEYVGAAIREELFTGSEADGFAWTGLTKGKPVLLIMGGSGGSQKINDTVRASLEKLLPIFQIIHICGQDNSDPSYNRPGYVQYEYVNEELKNLFAITDYVLSRAGANAIFEFLALRIPMLLIPLSLAASRGDQIVNAKSFQKSGYAYMLEEEDMTDHVFVEEILKLRDYGSVLIDNMKQSESEKARERIVEIIKETVSYG